MRVRLALLVALVALGALRCGNDHGERTVLLDTIPDSAAAADVVPSDAAVVMPDVPTPVRGRLVTVSAGRDTLAGTWAVRAGRCADPSSVQVMSETGDVGTLILLVPPDSGSATITYPMHAPDTALGAGAARMGVQRFRTPQPAAYEVRTGAVTLERLDRRVSGRFTATLRNLTTRDTVLYAGVFHEVPVESLAADLCAAAADSVDAD